MNFMLSLLWAFGAGITIVLSRSVNAFLAKHIGATQSSFFNYISGLLTSCLFLVCFAFPNIHQFEKLTSLPNYWMLLGGVIGVANIVILNLVVRKIAPLQLTLYIFIAQLLSGMLLDLVLYEVFSIQKLIGCAIVLLGLLHYQSIFKRNDLR